MVAADPYAMNEQKQLITTFYVGLASFTILVWDHLLTLEDEVQYIWKKRKSLLIWLFLVNRYLTPLGFIVNLYAYFSGFATESMCVSEQCEHFVRYEGSMTVIGINTSALMMLLRVYAMYNKKKVIVTVVAVVFALELGTNAWLLTYGIAVRHTQGIHACTMIFDTHRINRVVAAASAWLPLLYDTIVLLLTVRRTYAEVKYPSVGRTMRTLLKEGVLYYSVIFCVTLVLTLMIVLAPNGIKNVMAQTEYLMTVAMMSRITLHLKKESHQSVDLGTGTGDINSSIVSRTQRGTPMTFANPSGRQSAVLSPLSISVQEHSVTYNDCGEEVQMPKKSLQTAPHPKRYSYEAEEQWFEFTPLTNPLSR